jgi:hypothetical protein
MLTAYERMNETVHLNHLIVDREAMAEDFWAHLNTRR